MKITNCRSSVAFLVCSAAVLVIVNGKTTTDDEIAELRTELAKAVGRNSKLEDLLAASVDINAELNRRLAASKPDASEFSTMT